MLAGYVSDGCSVANLVIKFGLIEFSKHFFIEVAFGYVLADLYTDH